MTKINNPPKGSIPEDLLRQVNEEVEKGKTNFHPKDAYIRKAEMPESTKTDNNQVVNNQAKKIAELKTQLTETQAHIERLLYSCLKVSAFVKHNEYPSLGSQGFNELTTLLNNQEIALKQSPSQSLKQVKAEAIRECAESVAEELQKENLPTIQALACGGFYANTVEYANQLLKEGE